jgi:hypothetical protein
MAYVSGQDSRLNVIELRKQVEPLLRKPWEVGLSDEDMEAYYAGVREALDSVEKTVLPQLRGAVGGFERVALLAEWLQRDRREPDKVLAYAQELANLVTAHGGQ